MSRSFIFVELYICKLYTCRPFAGRKCAGNFCRNIFRQATSIYFYQKNSTDIYSSTRKISQKYIYNTKILQKHSSSEIYFYQQNSTDIYICLQIYISVNKIVFTLQIYISTRKSLQKYFSTIELNLDWGVRITLVYVHKTPKLCFGKWSWNWRID